MATTSPKRRYQRIGLPRGPFVAWRGVGQRLVSRVQTMGLGGLFIVTPEPPPAGEAIRLYFEVPEGEVRAGAVVRSSARGKGMGVEFTAMNPDARARLQKLLSRLLEDPCVKVPSVNEAAKPAEERARPEPPQASDTAVFEREMKEMLALAETGTYYQLLRMTSGSPRAQVRHSYYELVRKFHPDRHMDHAEWTQPLHKLMEAVTLAYKTLTDEAARREYDERLAASGSFALGRRQSELQKSAEECMEKARECFRAQNPGGAILWLRKATEIEPKSDKYQALLARALSAVAPFRREAAEHFEKALERDPWNTVVRLQLAELYEDMKLPWRACAHYQKTLEIDADNPRAQARLRVLDVKPSKRKRSSIDRIFRRTST